MATVGMDWESNFRERMEQMRTAAGMTQTDLARVLREQYGLPFHQATIQRIEAGERPVRLNEAHLIAHAFQTDLETMTAAYGTSAVVVSNLIAAAKGFTVSAGNISRFLTEQAPGMEWGIAELRKAWEAYADAQQRAGLEVDRGLAELVTTSEACYGMALAAIGALVEIGRAVNVYNAETAAGEAVERNLTADDVKIITEHALIGIIGSEQMARIAIKEGAETDGINHQTA